MRFERVVTVCLAALLAPPVWGQAAIRPAPRAIGPVRMRPDVRLAYIHGADVTTANAYKALLESAGCRVTLVAESDAASADFDACQRVIIGPDVGLFRGSAASGAAGRIVRAGTPVLGLGHGGASFFAATDLALGKALGKVPARGVQASSVEPVGGRSRAPLQLYTTPVPAVVVRSPRPVEGLAYVGRRPGDRGGYLIAGQGRHLFWGFDAGPDRMTQDGRKVFLRLVSKTLRAGKAAGGPGR